jgi:hypothetical protein
MWKTQVRRRCGNTVETMWISAREDCKARGSAANACCAGFFDGGRVFSTGEGKQSGGLMQHLRKSSVELDAEKQVSHICVGKAWKTGRCGCALLRGLAIG